MPKNPVGLKNWNFVLCHGLFSLQIAVIWVGLCVGLSGPLNLLHLLNATPSLRCPLDCDSAPYTIGRPYLALSRIPISQIGLVNLLFLKHLSEDCSRASTRRICPKQKSHEKGPNTVFLDRRGPRKSHEKVTSKNATSNVKSKHLGGSTAPFKTST